jgi:transposase
MLKMSSLEKISIFTEFNLTGVMLNKVVKFKGMNKNMFKLYLKECEFRFNSRKQNLYKILLEICRKDPLN